MAEAKTKTKQLGVSDYVHLHNHTHHSLLDGLTKVPALVDAVKEAGMEAVAITDHGTLSGTVEFYKAAKEIGVKPIIGMETYVAARTIADRDPAKDKARYHLILLAMDQTGYRNLMKLSTVANLEGFYYKARIDHDLLEKYGEGLIVLSGCASSELGEALRVDDYDKAKQVAEWYKSVFGDRYYIEVQDHGHPEHTSKWDEQVKINKHLIKLAEELSIEMVVTCDAHYLKHADSEAHEILLCVQTGAFLADQGRMSLSDFELHVTDPKEIIERWGKQYPRAVSNSRQIADRCNVELDLGKILIPTFPTPKGEDEKSYLHKLVWRGLAQRYGGKSADQIEKLTPEEAKKSLGKDIIERADYELGVMDSMGYNGYFLIVQDFINWGKNRGIIFGPGRGSAAGSIVSYALKITEIDPMGYGLMFERFLNPNRISMPDIDIDIQDTRRNEVIEYCVQKYGKERVANIATFGTMAARAAIRDVARVLQVPYAEADRLSKLVPPPVQGRHIPLGTSVREDPDLKKEYESSPSAKQVIDLAIKLEGTIRSHGIHAAGVVIAPDDIVNFTPLEMAQKGVVATQYPMGPVEELGLLKMDFLGLSNLTILKNALRIISKVYKVEIELSDIKNDDDKAFELFRQGDTTGVFQFESAGMKRYMKELQPTEFSDLVAMNALYRPGPMAEIPRFIKGKNDAASVAYLHQSLEPILRDTYGVMVYQEQIINLLQLVAGYTPGEADLVRKAIGKKKRDIMQAEEPKFIAGCKKQGLTERQAEQLWAQIQPFADYSFNKAHATCYAQIAYWTAYLKAHYPAAFMAALMTSDQGDIDRLAIEISECSHMGIKVLSPDINESFHEFSVVPGESQIRFGLDAVKGVGTGAVEEILIAREDGPFKTVADFAGRVGGGKFNRKAWESLIKAGAFDKIADRSDLLFNLDSILAYSSKLSKQKLSGQTDLFGNLTDSVVVASLNLENAPTKHDDRERLAWERELLGLYLSAHPLDHYQFFLEEKAAPLSSLTPEDDKRKASVGGLISDIRSINTKSGSKMAFVKVEDKSGELEVIIFPKLYESLGDSLVLDQVVLVSGKISSTDRDGNPLGEAKLIADVITPVSQEEIDNFEPTGQKAKPLKARAKKSAPALTVATDQVVEEVSAPAMVVKPVEPKTVYVHVKDPNDHDRLVRLKQSANSYPGEDEIILVLGTDKKTAMRLPFSVDGNGQLTQQIIDIYGETSVVVK
ncbi:MAG TPA: DNA polymerase III subunit alpha [Candidatus Saccharimonadales bacterium]|nr:DNA polymerase III subunit alpha [Candidatus Saccharimonadales bacterium]